MKQFGSFWRKHKNHGEDDDEVTKVVADAGDDSGNWKYGCTADGF